MINRELTKVYSVNNSYLRVVEPGVQESDLAIYRIENDKLAPVKELACQTPLITLIEILPHQTFTLKKVLPDLINRIEYRGRLHIVITASANKSNFIWVFSYLLVKRYLKQLKRVNIEVLGLIPGASSPQIVMAFRKNVYQHIVSSFYRGMDNPLKRFVKEFTIILFGQFVWRGSIALVVRKGDKVLRPGKTEEHESWLDDEEVQDRFVFITSGKKIAFIFRKGGKRPEAVLKYGKLAEIEKEYINHRRAHALFPGLVPEIHFFKSEGDIGKLCMEYIDDIHLNNVVASTCFGRKRKYLKEIEDIFLFLMEILKSLPLREGKLEDAYSYQIMKTIFNDELPYLDKKKEINNVRKVIQEVSRVTCPLVMQHRDFCLANILYTDKNMGRKVIIDWEDCKEEDLPLVDLNMLLISVIQAYKDLFKGRDEDLYHDKDVMKIIADERETIRQYLGMEKGFFKNISILSTFSLWSQNVQKGRIKISEEIFSFLNRELS